MAFNKDQNEPKVPLSNSEKRETSNLLPRYYRTKDNKKFLQSTLDQLVQPGTVKKVFGYIGKESAKAATSEDIFLAAPDKIRQDYQLEPAAVIKDYLGNTTFFKDYIDHINRISVADGNVENHSRINKEEFYSWNPHVNWDKFVNFQQYYWLPFGPDAIPIPGQQLEVISEYTVELSDEVDNFAYLFTPNGLTRNPTLKLFRGQTYIFDIVAPEHPFSIKTSRTAGTLDRYTKGVDGIAVEEGKITFTVPRDCPDVLYYVSENEVDTAGVFQILDIEENTFLDLDADIIGKKTYTIPTEEAGEVALSNGMKIYFTGNVSPSEYAEGFWYVEGVGSQIKLISELEVEVRSTYTEEQTLLFDDLPFDQLPYSETGTFPSRPDYITINRGSIDNNPWSRYNRWFHRDVIEVSATVNNRFADLSQSARATRPIIEFDANIKLFNYGIVGKKHVDVIDNFTKDAFSTIEGSLGYNVDGIDLADGMRVLFNAETDILVKNKIYKVNFINVQIPGRILEFNATTNVNLIEQVISFSEPHGLLDGNEIIYVQNTLGNVPGLVNRKNYYVKLKNAFSIELYSDVALTNRVELLATTSGTHSFELYLGLRRQIQLTEEPDSTPNVFEAVSVRFGENDQVTDSIIGNQGQNYWFNGTNWVLAQTKTAINQPPLFDVFDENGNSYSDVTVYEGSSFSGTKIYSYKEGVGTADSVLGFPLSYKNINNVGDIVFNFDLLQDSFEYKEGLTLKSKDTNYAYLKKSTSLNDFKFENGWKTSKIKNTQPAVRIYKNSGLLNNFPIDMFDNKNDLLDLDVRAYINGRRLNKSEISLTENLKYKVVVLENDVSDTDIVTIKCYTKQNKNNNGHYEIPINLQNNPLNDSILEFTLGQVVDHVDSIIDNITDFTGVFPGPTNLRDLGNLTPYGTRFIQHAGSLNSALYHLGNKDTNILKALDEARKDYSQFKRAFLIAATNSGVDLDAKRHVDIVLQTMSQDKPKTQPYYLSDMFGYSASNKIEIEVVDFRIKTYPLSQQFNLESLSNRAISIYLNGEQLLVGRDYMFGDDTFVEISAELADGDIIEIIEYESTDGCFCAPTPTKLGIYPAYEPNKYIDNSYLEPTEVIQGHDGSITVAYGDFRDDLILELEKRIFNNIKCQYKPEIFDIYNYIPGYNRATDYTVAEFNKILSKYFYQWAQTIPQDFTKHEDYDRLNSFTFNYNRNYTVDEITTPGSWRGIYNWLFDTDTPHLTPWEMLGYSIKPKWFEDEYGPAPYTKDNEILWNDLKLGAIKEPGRPVRYNKKFERPILNLVIPVDAHGNLLSPEECGAAQGYTPPGDNGSFVFGDGAKVEAAWRKSSYYPFAVLQALILMHPAEVLGRCFDRSRIVKNLSDQLVYSETNLRFRLKDAVIPTTANDDVRVQTCGLVNYVADYLTSENTARLTQYAEDLNALTNNISTRLGGFTSKDKFNLILDSKSPDSSGGVFIPAENYFVDLNVSSAIKKVSYSGIIITKFSDGFEVKGYDFENPYFNYYSHRADEQVIRIGGVSESFTQWNSNKQYVAGKIVEVSGEYYRVLVSHTSGTELDTSLFVRLPALPLTGGREVILRKNWDTTEVKQIAYGTKLESIQEVVDVIQGYGAYLEAQGFVFDDFNNNISKIANWKTSVREFVFWTTQGWDVGSVISISPAADRIVFNSDTSVVDNLEDTFYGYSIYRVDGQPLPINNVDVYRNDNNFILEPNNTNYGIYAVTLYLVQKEHIAVLDDTTLFNDTIYDKPAGYRQEKIKVLGYVTSNWNGGFDIPGFVYDRAIINEWNQWTDYNLGDIVKYKEFYYSATQFLPGTETFVDENWVLLEGKPKSELLPNLDYRAEQFTDFYDLDTDNFDAEQQKVAQHLTGYQKRQYLENIINNDVSQYKFYQGMITEKGTQNSLNKLFDVLSADDSESLTFSEEWAFRVGEYGSLDTFDEYEFILDEGQFKINPQPYELVNTIDPLLVDFVYRETPTNVYIKPAGTTTDIWTTKKLPNYLRTPGYVRLEDVNINVDTLSDLLTVDITNFVEGDYVWTSAERLDWNVYRFTKSEFNIINATYESPTLTLECNIDVDYVVGDVVGIENSVLKGFYIIESVTGEFITVNAPELEFDDFDNQSTILFYILTKARVSNADDIDSIIPLRIKNEELIWVDDTGSNQWTVYKNSSETNFNKSEVVNTNPATGLNFGKSVSVNDLGTLAAVATNTGVFIYKKVSFDNTWSSLLYIAAANVELVHLSGDGNILAIADATANANEGLVDVYFNIDGNYILANTFTGADYSVTEFGKNIVSTTIGDTIYIAIASANSVEVYSYTSENIINIASILPPNAETTFGSDISFAKNTGSLVIASVADNSVFVYIRDEDTFTLSQTISKTPVAPDTNLQFGNAVSISASETYIAIGSPTEDIDADEDRGVLYVYRYDGTEYVEYQTITSRQLQVNEQFAYEVAFMNDDETLVVYVAYSSNGTNIINRGFDNDTTIFDSNSTRFADYIPDVGRIDVYDRYNTKFIYGKSIETNSIPNTQYGRNISVGQDVILATATDADDKGFLNSGKVYSYKKPARTTGWMPFQVQAYRVDTSTIKKAFLYNKETSQIVKYLDVVDPTQGKIPGIADQEIKFKSYFDPATYSNGIEGTVNVDDGMAWKEKQVGMLWWDLSNARFLDTESGDVVYKTSVWNKLYDTASIDIYEWVESTVTPERWNELFETEEGNALGISGTTKYGPEVYSVKRKYDNISQRFKNTYYFWVKDKVTIPNIEGRTLNALNVANLIADPLGYGYPCLAFNDSNSVSLVNVKQYIEDKNIVLSVQKWTSDDRESNYHSQWKLLSTNRNTNIPGIIEEKWKHSLIGKDNADRLVPDISLPAKQRYGIEYRPRQGMFVNRIEALKQYVERVNSVLKDVLVADTYDISSLTDADPAPTEISGRWDLQIDSNNELRFVTTTQLRTATLVPILEDGSIVDIEITNSGKGYGKFRVFETDTSGTAVSWTGPTVTITGEGIDASVSTIINNLGEVINTVINNPGEGYLINTTALAVRPFTVLTSVDTETNGWSLYSFDSNKTNWYRSAVQTYNVNSYWKYIDWYASGYNQFVKVNFLLDNTYELVTTDIPVGSIAKIRNIGSGGWVLLEKFNDLNTIDYTLNFKVVGRENGTIQFLSNIYDTSIKGFDRFLLDTVGYDIYPVEELRIIFDVVKNNLLVDDLKVEYLKLFFASVRYALYEQTYLDWAFKTSFVKAQHNLGKLSQKVTYNSDNLESFEQYINEVKPYHTKVREYVSNYNSLDPTQTAVTDFDLLPVIDSENNVKPLTVTVSEDGTINSEFDELYQYPWAFWKDNLGFEVTSIEIVDQGEGYTVPPVVEFTGVQLDGGTPAKAKAYITKGKVNRIDLLNPGSKWIKAPIVTLNGGTLEGGRPARAIAVIGNSPIRSSYIKVKFDRVSKTYQVTTLTQTETFTGSTTINVSGSRTQFPLVWSPNTDSSTYSVIVNGAEALKNEYSLTLVETIVNGETRYSGLLTFVEPPVSNAEIVVNYLKNYNHLTATDRINFFYNPTTGQVGKDLGQLMTGIDYGGVNITGLGFKNQIGWDSQPWFSDVWDGTSGQFEDVIEQVVLDPVVEGINATLDEGETIVTFTSGDTTGIEPGMTIVYVAGTGKFSTTAKVLTVISETEITVSSPHVESGTVLFGIFNPSNTYRLPFVPEENEQITVYVSRFNNNPLSENYRSYEPAIRIDDENYLTISQTNENAVMTTFVGDGETDIIVLPTDANLQVYNDVSEEGFDGSNDLESEYTKFVDGGTASTLNFINVDGNLVNTQPLTFGDRVIFRKVTSDGSIVPDSNDYDTELSGGDLAYSTATGFAPDDVILDGDALITPDNSPAPEEVVPGQIMDALAIKVYTRPSGGAPNIMFKTYTGDGLSLTFEIGQYFLNSNSVIVKVNNTIQTLDVDYVVDMRNNTIVFGNAPAITDLVSIISFSFNSSTVLDIDYFIADGETSEYITRAPWYDDLSVTILVNGQPATYELFSTNSEYATSPTETWRSRVGINFLVPPVEGSLINYVIDRVSTEQTASVVKSESFAYQVGQDTYALSNEVGISMPFDPNVLVKVGNSILRSTSYTYFTMENDNLLYEVQDSKYQGLMVNSSDFKVYAQGNELTAGTDYFIAVNNPTPFFEINELVTSVTPGVNYQVGDLLELLSETPSDTTAIIEVVGVDVDGGITEISILEKGIYTTIPSVLLLNNDSIVGAGAFITTEFVSIQDFAEFGISLSSDSYIDGGDLVVGISTEADYTFNSATEIVINREFVQDDVVEVISFYNHNLLGIERTVDTFSQTPVLDQAGLEYAEYLGKLGGVFTLRSTVPSIDFVWVIKNGELLTSNVDYLLESDFRTVRFIDYPIETDVIEIIAFTNTVISDSYGYMQFKDSLNRTHYKRLNKNKTTRLAQPLSQLDTSIVVTDASMLDVPIPSVNRPGIIEINGERIEYFNINNNELTQLRRATLGTGSPTVHNVDSLVQGLGATETIPYTDSFDITEGSTIQHPNLYSTGEMQLDFNPLKDEVEVFVGGYRLKKNPYVLYNYASGYPYSPTTPITEDDAIGTTREGDVKLPPEFTISGTGMLKLAQVPVDEASGTRLRVVVVKKQGLIWNNVGERLANSNNEISNFLTEVEAEWPDTF